MADPDEFDDLPSSVSSSFRAFGPSVNDAICPMAIRHEVNETNADGQLLHRYNYLEYEFEKDGLFCRARSYVEAIGDVAIFGPFAGREDLRPAIAPEFRDNVLDYLKRRFDHITELGEEGYVTVWSRSA